VCSDKFEVHHKRQPSAPFALDRGQEALNKALLAIRRAAFASTADGGCACVIFPASRIKKGAAFAAPPGEKE
jgi:hypothetical protein